MLLLHSFSTIFYMVTFLNNKNFHLAQDTVALPLSISEAQ